MPTPLITANELGVSYRQYSYRAFTLKELVTGLFRRNAFEEFWALDGISFTVPRGEVLGVIGANGSGKSTLLKALCHVLPPSRGSVEITGTIAPLIELGGGFNAELTGQENVFLNGAILGMTRSEMSARYDAIVEFAGLKDFMQIPLHNYSSGMRVRLAFAVATEVDPDIMLLDEVFAVGDENFRQKTLKRLEAFIPNAATVIVSHNTDMIRSYCTKTILLDHGRIVASGDTPTVLEHYKEMNSAGALGVGGHIKGKAHNTPPSPQVP